MLIRILVIIFCNMVVLLIGCSTAKHNNTARYGQKYDSAPQYHGKDLTSIPDAVPVFEAKSKYGNPKSYVVFNKKYHVLDSSHGYKAIGLASWYGTKFHGHRTSSGEVYDMYKMTAAHKTLPLPTYLQVKNLANGKTIIVKVNDRGPFHSDRILDLSYAAAAKLDILRAGTAKIEVTSIVPTLMAANSKNTIAANELPTANESPIAQKQLSTVNSEKTLAIKPIKVTETIEKPTAVAAATESAPIMAPNRYLQIGAFNNRENAENLRTKVLQLINGAQPVAIQSSLLENSAIFRVRIGPFKDQHMLQQIKNAIIQASLPAPIAMP